MQRGVRVKPVNIVYGLIYTLFSMLYLTDNVNVGRLLSSESMEFKTAKESMYFIKVFL